MASKLSEHAPIPTIPFEWHLMRKEHDPDLTRGFRAA